MLHRLSPDVVSRSYSSLQCAGFSLWWLLLLQSTGSRHMGFSSCGLRALEHWLSSCGAQAQLLLGMWDTPVPGIESGFPALAGRFLTIRLPGQTHLEGRQSTCREAATQMMLHILLESQETADLPKYGCPQATKPGHWPQALCPPHLWLRLRSLSLQLHQ